MRTPTISSVGYAPGTPPESDADIRSFLLAELTKISAVLAALAAGHIDVSYAPPAKPRDGDIRYADGTTWNPGSGKGMYRYNGTAWVLLG